MLHYACIFGRENIVRQLLEAGCAVNIVNNDGNFVISHFGLLTRSFISFLQATTRFKLQ